MSSAWELSHWKRAPGAAVRTRAVRCRGVRPSFMRSMTSPHRPAAWLRPTIRQHGAGMTISGGSAAACLHSTSSPPHGGAMLRMDGGDPVVFPLAGGQLFATSEVYLEKVCSFQRSLLWRSDLGSRRHDEVMLRMNAGMTLCVGCCLPTSYAAWCPGCAPPFGSMAPP